MKAKPYRVPRYRVRLVRDGTVRVPTSDDAKCCSAWGAAGTARYYLRHEATEVVIAILLDARTSVVGIVEVSRGGTEHAALLPVDVVRPAILANARAIVLAHNHPSGDTTPSRNDLSTTQVLKRALETVGLELVDHVIVGPTGGYHSMLEAGEL